MCNDTEEWWKSWGGIDLSLQNWHNKFDEFWIEHSKVSKIYTLMGYFWPKHIMLELKGLSEKLQRKLSFITPESDRKFEEKLTCDLENNMKNLANFDQSTWKSQNWDFPGVLLSKVENVWV